MSRLSCEINLACDDEKPIRRKKKIKDTKATISKVRLKKFKNLLKAAEAWSHTDFSSSNIVRLDEGLYAAVHAFHK